MIVQDTTTNIDINGPDVAGQKGGHYTLAKGKGSDENELRDKDRDSIVRADVDKSRELRAIAKGKSLPNGEWAIRSDGDLRAALNRFLNPPSGDSLSSVYGPDEIQRHIISQARRLGLVSILPASWGVSQEDARKEIEKNRLFVLSYRQLEQESRFFSANIRRQYAQKGIALPDGSFPIPDKDALRRAIRLVGKGGAKAKRHIIKRARALGATSMLPEAWGLANENSVLSQETLFEPTLILDGENVPNIMVLEDNSTDQGGVVRMKVPFYVSESVVHAPGFLEKIHFPGEILQETIQSGKNRISAGKQPLTVYGRHSHALDGKHLPIGGIVDLVQEGKIGYVICDIVNEGDGKQAIALMKRKPPLLNAVSLRAAPKNFTMQRVKVGDERMLRLSKLEIDGVDFAPDSPAQETYGIQILAAETPVVQLETPKIEEERKDLSDSDNLTLESLSREYPSLVEELEMPWRDQVAALKQEISKKDARIAEFEALERQRDLDAFVQELADKTGRADEVLPTLRDIAKECKTREEFSSKVMPFMMESMESMRKGGAVNVQKVETTEEKLQKLFPSAGGNGQVNGLTQESSEEEEEKGEKVGLLAVPE